MRRIWHYANNNNSNICFSLFSVNPLTLFILRSTYTPLYVLLFSTFRKFFCVFRLSFRFSCFPTVEYKHTKSVTSKIINVEMRITRQINRDSRTLCINLKFLNDNDKKKQIKTFKFISITISSLTLQIITLL